MRRLLAVGCAVVGAFSAANLSAAPIGPEVQFKRVDVSLLCTAIGAGRFYEVKMIASPASGTFQTAGGIFIQTGPGFGAETLLTVAGDDPNSPRPGVFSYHRLRCGLTKARIPLDTRGLAGPARTFVSDFECDTKRRFIVRARATLKSAGGWTILGERREQRGIRRTVLSSAVTVRSWPARKPLLYASLDARGNTRILAAASCRG